MTDLKQQARRMIELDGERTQGEWRNNGGAFVECRHGFPVFSAAITLDRNLRNPCDAAFTTHTANHAPAIARAYLDQCDENERLCSAISDKGGTEHAPTQWAYDQACSALAKHKGENERFRTALQNIVDSYVARSELYTNDADLAGNLHDFARKALGEQDV